MSIWAKIFRKCADRATEVEGDSCAEAHEAVARADLALDQVKEQGPEIQEITDRFHTLRVHNSFAEMITALFGGAR